MRNQCKSSRSAGFSLIELLIVISIISLMMLFVMPRAGVIYDRAMLRGARTSITNMYLSSRVNARTRNQVAVFRQRDDSIWVEVNNYAPATTKVVVRPPTDLQKQYGVTITTGNDSIRVDPRGMIKGTGSTTYTYIFSRNGLSDSVVINGYGRVLR